MRNKNVYCQHYRIRKVPFLFYKKLVISRYNDFFFKHGADIYSIYLKFIVKKNTGILSKEADCILDTRW